MYLVSNVWIPAGLTHGPARCLDRGVLVIGIDSEAYAPFIHAWRLTADEPLVSNTYINGTNGPVY